MAQLIEIKNGNLHAAFEIDDNKNLRFLHLGNDPYSGDIPEREKYAYRPFELLLSGELRFCYGIGNYFQSYPDGVYLYISHRQYETKLGTKLEFLLEGRQLLITLHYEFISGTDTLRSWMEIVNNGDTVQTLEYVSSFALTGICRNGILPYQKKTSISIPHNAWAGEMRWKQFSMDELGMSKAGNTTFKRISYNTCGTWSSGEYLPMGYIENTETGQGLLWQIEHNGSWYFEISDYENLLYINLCGPNEKEGHWYKHLKEGDRFVTVPAAVCTSAKGFEDGCRKLTDYRRKIYRKCEDVTSLPVVCNDWMNGLAGNKTTALLLPLIDAAAEAGCEYFCIDAGWYVEPEQDWNSGLGLWHTAKKRFPKGIQEVTGYIRSKCMLPGIWLEIESVGSKCPLAQQVPRDWFFCRHGHPVVTMERYQLDFRNPQVVAYADSVIDRVVNEYGAAFIKMDYNHNAGPGTELYADSTGDGLLAHNRAYLRWIESVFERYPDLIIENCGSGGMRLDYAMLARHSLQSVTDCGNYKTNAYIAAACASALTPEQAGIWAYPVEASDEEATVFNMINGMLVRLYLGGRTDLLKPECFRLVKEAVACYKTIRKDIPASAPVWPLGFPKTTDGWLCFGLEGKDRLYLAVWRLDDAKDYVNIPLESFAMGANLSTRCIYPGSRETCFAVNNLNKSLSVRLPQTYCARLFEISK